MPPGRSGRDAAMAGDQPFLGYPDGVGWLFVGVGLKGGRLPTHYEPPGVAGSQSSIPTSYGSGDDRRARSALRMVLTIKEISKKQQLQNGELHICL